jgi:stage III sporulation protein AD
VSFFAILGFALIVTVLLLIVRKERPELAVLLSLAAAAMILVSLLQNIREILVVFERVALETRLNISQLKLIVKIVGIAYLAGFGAQICRDAGEGGMAAKVELAGKVFILSMGIPVMFSLLGLILKFLDSGGTP